MALFIAQKSRFRGVLDTFRSQVFYTAGSMMWCKLAPFKLAVMVDICYLAMLRDVLSSTDGNN
jgi:hypothetical protein